MHEMADAATFASKYALYVAHFCCGKGNGAHVASGAFIVAQSGSVAAFASRHAAGAGVGTFGGVTPPGAGRVCRFTATFGGGGGAGAGCTPGRAGAPVVDCFAV